MKKITTKRDLGLALISLLGTILLLSLVWLGIGNKNIIRHDENAQINNKVRYVLVNEDNGATFNGKTYNLGGDFIKLVSRDTKHEWQTASYDMAEAGIKNGTYDVEVVIPENFSSRILALQSTAPKQAGISYRVRKEQNEVTNQAVGRNVDSMINYFNNRVVRMYFTSLVGNLRSAQFAMGTVANRQTSQVNDLASQVQQPFQGLNDQFSSLFSTANILDQDPLTDSQMTQDFSNNVRSLLQDLNQGLASGDDANTALNEELTKQLQRYDALNSQTSTYQLAVGNYLENGSLISSLSDTTSSFLKDTQANQASLEGQLQQLSEQYQVLRTLQQQLETEYGLTKTSQAENLAALKAKLTGDSSANTQVLKNFAAQMKQSLANLPLAEDLTNDSELTKDLWNSQDKAQYQAAVKILTKYAKNLDSAYGTQKVTYLEKNSQQDTYTGTVTLNLTVGQTNTIKLNGDKVTGKVEPAQITQALTTAGYQNVVVSAFKNNQLTVRFTAPSSTAKNAKTTPTANTKETTSSEAQVETTEESPSEATSSESQATSESATSESASASSSAKSEESTETQPTTTAKNVAISFNVDYQVDASTEYKWSVDDQVQSTGKFELVSQTDSTKLNQNVAQTIALAHEIKAVYGQSQSSLADFLAN
ncbi:type VII secretion protein EsaA [Ligilactobacillus apodemi]|uniref:Type VII secretion system accessory factor EsaA n=1 Tax=Ligilactobacillus apodemi DSM 16634 = JCM 16172 TaxID=1423724 RepID=A0A0R1TXB5_9LACO|nr:type VII secretion protein EsaA [Ligilactobacillus apodemi]KRL83427.1 hypothetical protein FC32_GL000679 [Ligilactobacillus apodemi DSM 16634 = JCM 16172]